MKEIERIPINIGVFFNECYKNVSYDIIRNYFNKVSILENIHAGLNGRRWPDNLTRRYNGRSKM